MKKKSVVVFILMLAGAFVSGYFGPWWAPAAFILLTAALMNLSTRQSLFTGMVVQGLIFLFMAVWMKSQDEANIIGRTGNLLGGLSPLVMIVLTTVIGSLTGLLSGWLGSVLGKTMRNQS